MSKLHKFDIQQFKLVFAKEDFNALPDYHCYNSITLGLIKKRNLVFRLTQENLIEFWIQCIYLYILATDGLCSTLLAYPKWPYISHEVNIYYICCIISLFFKSSTIFYMTMWPLLWPCHLMWLMCNSMIMTSL